MSKGKRKSWQPTGLEAMKQSQIDKAKWQKGLQQQKTPVIQGGFSKGVLSFSETGKYEQIKPGQIIQHNGRIFTYGDGTIGIDRGFGQTSPYDLETLKKLLEEANGTKIAPEEPKDTRNEQEKWADDWARKNGGSNPPTDSTNTNT